MLAIVTGGCHGLGKCFSLELLNRGYDVIATYNNSVEEANELMTKYPNIKCIKCNNESDLDIKNVLANIDHIDILINNAGIANDNYFYDKTREEFLHILNVNLVGTFSWIKYASSKIKDGIIVNISSNNTLGNHNPLSMDYDASKAGINILTLDYAEALKENSTKVIAIAPGWIDTESIREMNPHFLKEELKKSNQEKLIGPDLLAKKIIDIAYSDIESGSIIEIKEVDDYE